jgi:hypothetical protein
MRRAIVIETSAKAEAKLVCFLRLLGIEWESLTSEELLGRHGPEILAARDIEACLIASGEGLRELKSALDRRKIPAPSVGRAFVGTLFHSLDQSPALLRALEGFFSRCRIEVPKHTSGHVRYHVSDKYPEMCGPLSGLSFAPTEESGCGIEFESGDGVANTIISAAEVSLLTRVSQGSHEVFIASSPEILDLTEPVSKNIDYRTCFSRIVPILVALRRLFRDSCWAPEAYYANIIIDDPPLWPRYGYFDLRELAALVDRTKCACTIAMIPWNYRRSIQRAVSLTASRRPNLGVCVHGCNHTGAEFSCQDRPRLRGMLLTARQRLDAHHTSTGLPYQPVMVFPQGVFSVEAMSCLRAEGYLAAVNTEVADCWRQARVTLRDLLAPAVLCYDGTPLFTRRNPADGPVNFAVDSFLGKPCLVVLHHDFFKGGIKNLEELVSTFSNLHPKMSWDSLENIVKGCALSKRTVDGRKTVRIFTNQARIRVEEGEGEGLTLVKREAADDKISRVKVNGRAVGFTLQNGAITLAAQPPVHRMLYVNIETTQSPAVRVTEDSLREKAHVAVRRYLCEFRDNYLSKSEMLTRWARAVAKPHADLSRRTQRRSRNQHGIKDCATDFADS